MEALERIMNRVKMNSMISRNTAAKEIEYDCARCRDSGWIQAENGDYVRCKCVEVKRLKALWDKFGVKSEDVKPLNQFIPYDERTKAAKEKAEKYIMTYQQRKSNRENSFGLFGQPGAGKSHIVIAIGATLLNTKANPVPVVYMPYLEAMRELKANAMDDEYYNKLTARYSRAEVLIIDDLFKDKVKKGRLVGELTEADMKHIYPILNYRYLNHLPILFSTECTPKMLLDLDEALAGRILESCGDMITAFTDSKYNYRLRKFRKDNE